MRDKAWGPLTRGVAVAVLLAVAVAVAAWTVLWRRQRRPPVRCPSSAGHDTVPCVSTDDLAASAGAGAGLDVLVAPGDIRDAVISCWLELERAASAAGQGRRPEQTPTEFTRDLLVVRTDREQAVRELLALYHQARFGSRPLGSDTAKRAAVCLEAVRAAAPARSAG